MKITEGLVRNRGIPWFPDLIDKLKIHNMHIHVDPHSAGVRLMEATVYFVIQMKFTGVHYLGRSIKIHLYCSQDPDQLREFVLNIPEHYKVHVHAAVCMIYTQYTCVVYNLYRETTQDITPLLHATLRTTHLARFRSLMKKQSKYSFAT